MQCIDKKINIFIGKNVKIIKNTVKNNIPIIRNEIRKYLHKKQPDDRKHEKNMKQNNKTLNITQHKIDKT